MDADSVPGSLELKLRAGLGDPPTHRLRALTNPASEFLHEVAVFGAADIDRLQQGIANRSAAVIAHRYAVEKLVKPVFIVLAAILKNQLVCLCMNLVHVELPLSSHGVLDHEFHHFTVDSIARSFLYGARPAAEGLGLKEYEPGSITVLCIPKLPVKFEPNTSRFITAMQVQDIRDGLNRIAVGTMADIVAPGSLLMLLERQDTRTQLELLVYGIENMARSIMAMKTQ